MKRSGRSVERVFREGDALYERFLLFVFSDVLNGNNFITILVFSSPSNRY
jgi:hypothetical protein